MILRIVGGVFSQSRCMAQRKVIRCILMNPNDLNFTQMDVELSLTKSDSNEDESIREV